MHYSYVVIRAIVALLLLTSLQRSSSTIGCGTFPLALLPNRRWNLYSGRINTYAVEPMASSTDTWFAEKEVMWPGQRFSLKVKGELVNKQSTFQHIQVFDTETYGRMLVLDGVIQLTERDEFSYQEMLTHVPLFAHAKPSRVLIVGGGDGGILREVLKHSCVEQVTMVEIDGQVIDVAKEYFRDSTCTHNFSDTRLKLIVGDGAAFLKECPPDTFDIVLVDSSDPVGPASVLFENAFYKSIHTVLAPGGIMCNQGECLWLHLDLIKDVLTFSKTLFEESRYFYTTVPTYPSGQIGFILNRKSNGPSSLDIASLHKPVRVPETELSSNLRYYTPAVHAAAFVLPKFAELKLGE